MHSSESELNVNRSLKQISRAYSRQQSKSDDGSDCSRSALCEAKKGDLAGVYVYKFQCVAQRFLLAYEYDPATRLLLLVGTHENFYRDLKR
ncbi:MAG: type II toxin-antitoxin system RelE/ParE family toxin [Alphaproteobacteria bacterium]|nr:type II toxin-antitoxin system RelE/ParE family toxin [Alphaproteobacteria bacterium]